MKMPYSAEQIERACIETVAVNRLAECYIRPLVYRGYSHVGVNPIGTPIEVIVAAYPWGKYLGDDALDQGRGGQGRQLGAHGAQHAAGDGQGRRQLPELAADEARGGRGRLRRGASRSTSTAT